MARLLLGFARTADELRLSLRLARVNGQPGVLASNPDGSPFSVISLDIAGGAVTALRSVVNPDKLRHLHPPELDAAPTRPATEEGTRRR
ncbi:MAG: hypothetical protein ICV74_09805 [Thermoleophilia bacterium]|nr:hypothetical protein [Thermoleophilia bacterium]